MPHIETDITPETPNAGLNRRSNGDSLRIFSKTGPATPVAEEEDRSRSEAASLCAQFLVKLSHQMRTPLSTILGVAQMMLEGSLSDSQKESVETVAESAQVLVSTADAIVDFAGHLDLLRPNHEAHQIELDGPELGGLGHRKSRAGSNSTGRHDVTPATREVEMPLKIPSRAKPPLPFNRGANFSTRVPPEIATQIRILVAEDHLTNQYVMLRMLARLGYTADAVCNGVDAVAALTRSPYDIVLMDCQMPELDGYEATRQIRRSGGRFKSTPIIAVTANAMDGDREKCLASGMNDYMSKPVLAQTLATTLEKWILPDAAGATNSAHTPPAASSYAAPSYRGQAQVQAESQSPSGCDKGAAPVEIGDAVDLGALETLRSIDAGDEGFMTKIIELFLTDLGERMEAMKTAADARDGAALKSIAHALKGSCGHFGAVRLAALCRKMEQIGLRQPVGDPSETLAELVAEAGRVRVALEEARKIAPTDS